MTEVREFRGLHVVVRPSIDPDRPGLEFVTDSDETLLATLWRETHDDITKTFARVWEEIDLWAFEEMSHYAEEQLGRGR